MANLQITVFEAATETLKGPVLQEELIAITGSSVQSNPIVGSDRRPRSVRFSADGDCWVNWGDDVTALNDGTGGRMLGADNPEIFTIDAGHVIAVIERV